jgi:hypothetical protein
MICGWLFEDIDPEIFQVGVTHINEDLMTARPMVGIINPDTTREHAK